MFDTHIQAWRDGERAANGGSDGVGAESGPRRLPPAPGSAELRGDPLAGVWPDRQPAADGCRWAPELGAPVDPAWGAPFRELLTLDPLVATLAELLGNPRFGHGLPSVPPQLRHRYRLDHDYLEWKAPYDPRSGPPRIPPPAPAGLHGRTHLYHIVRSATFLGPLVRVCILTQRLAFRRRRASSRPSAPETAAS